MAKNLSKNPNFNYNLFSGIKNEKIYSYTPDFTDFSVLYGNGYTYVAINGYIIGLSWGCMKLSIEPRLSALCLGYTHFI